MKGYAVPQVHVFPCTWNESAGGNTSAAISDNATQSLDLDYWCDAEYDRIKMLPENHVSGQINPHPVNIPDNGNFTKKHRMIFFNRIYTT
ncbi:MAG: hypothetical protein RBT34_04140 [Anaerolineaceae bacterium]|jgi:hypothetical protein|nr:hypothetical protein [Anaerolineaceae bacterium]